MRYLLCIEVFVKLSIVSLLISSCETPPPAHSAPAAIPVLATHPRPVDFIHTLETLGELKPFEEAAIQPQVEGRISAILVSEGERVEEGTSLFSMSSEPYYIKWEGARAENQLNKAHLDFAQKKLERFQKLYEQDYISEAEWEEMESQVEKCKATLLASEAHLKRARLDLSYCTIKAPRSGYIGTLKTYKGHLVTSGDTLTTLTELDPLMIEFKLTEQEAAALGAPSQAPLTFELQSLGSNQCCGTGKITYFDHHYEPQTALLLIRGQVPNKELKLRPGQTVRVSLPLGKKSTGLLIPQKAVKQSVEGPYVYIVNEDNTISFKPIVVGTVRGPDIIVESGLLPDDLIVTEGHLRLALGSKVTVKS